MVGGLATTAVGAAATSTSVPYTEPTAILAVATVLVAPAVPGIVAAAVLPVVAALRAVGETRPLRGGEAYTSLAPAAVAVGRLRRALREGLRLVGQLARRQPCAVGAPETAA